ncbi:signal peptidase I [Rhodopirellula halodulae]|uniref:signal peptidase I n=1 Tax=Rhodopirellula halodulae TaxID=2894198 RepID=UPI001E53F700|nr:signal peptidase I [Rhodopirellula sp. JC737]MCC9658491.1 signal peptidase I [Rhodopirellula sp. JC737]
MNQPIESKTTAEDTVSEAQAAFDAMSVPQQRAAVFRLQGSRETVEAFAVAFILALLFRAFIAEAFVIPTGSMAPALMGAHKDIFCDQCGQQFPIGASLENRTPALENAVVGGICPNCRHVNSLDLANDPNQQTFSGDRILVSKFAYTLKEPQRWDVIVFKVPVNPKQNYIKRLVGLPGETVSIRHGDIYARPNSEAAKADQPGDIDGSDFDRIENIGQIQRKPPEKLLAMSHLVYDSNHQAKALLDANYPSRLQPWQPGQSTAPENSWKVTASPDGLTATVQAEGDQTQWLRYYHRFPTESQWRDAIAGGSLADIDPQSGRLITDFYAYDAYLHVDSDRVYDLKPAPGASLFKRLLGQSRTAGVFKSNYESGGDLAQFRGTVVYGGSNHGSEGIHWVGDLIVTQDIETSGDAKQLHLEIVEAGVRHLCHIDLQTGNATLSLEMGRSSAEPQSFKFDGNDNLSPTAQTSIRAGQRHAIRFSNADNQLTLWVDDEVITFETPTTFDFAAIVPPDQNQPQYDGAGNPLDAAPVAIGVSGGSAELHQMLIQRDKYYIAVNNSNDGMLDYDMGRLRRFVGAGSQADEIVRDIQILMGEPTIWSEFPGWEARRTVSFRMDEDQFFPMGDNSPESLDARCWAGNKTRLGMYQSPDEDAYKFADVSYVPRDLLVGKALLVFWPHPWKKPLPFWPNLDRMQRIK